MATYPDRSTATQYAPAATRGRRSRRKRGLPPGMNFFRAPPRAAAIAGRRCANACRGSTTPRRWDSTSFISRRSIRLVTPIAKAETIPSPAEPGDPGVPYAIGNAGANGGGHKDDRARARHARGFRLAGRRNPQPRDGDRARFRDQLFARSSLRRANIRNGFTNDPTARSSTPRIRRRSTRTFIRSIFAARTGRSFGRK